MQEAPVKIAIINNGYLGMVRQWQELFHDRNYSASRSGSPDFMKLAQAYGVPGRRVVERREEVDGGARARVIAGPALIEFWSSRRRTLYPMIPSGGVGLGLT